MAGGEDCGIHPAPGTGGIRCGVPTGLACPPFFTFLTPASITVPVLAEEFTHHLYARLPRRLRRRLRYLSPPPLAEVQDNDATRPRRELDTGSGGMDNDATRGPQRDSRVPLPRLNVA